MQLPSLYLQVAVKILVSFIQKYSFKGASYISGKKPTWCFDLLSLFLFFKTITSKQRSAARSFKVFVLLKTEKLNEVRNLMYYFK